MRFLFLTLTTLAVMLSGSYAQEGLPFITDIKFNSRFSDARISGIVQDAEENMFFSTPRGVIRYDGSTWERIATPYPPQTIHFHQASHRLFVGLKSGAMEIVKSDSGTYTTKIIAGFNSKEQIDQIVSTESEIFIIGETEVFRLSTFLETVEKPFIYTDKLISGAFINQNSLYLLFYQEGLYQWKEGALEEKSQLEALMETQIIFSFQTNKSGTYLGTENDEVFIFNKGKIERLGGNPEKYVKENILSGGIMLNDSLAAFSTLAGGAIVISVESNTIRHQFDYSTGLKDNEIFCLGKDKDEGLWIAYEAGLSRIDLLQPVKSYSGYPGLEGNLTASLIVNGVLHVATGNGVYMLNEAKSTAEMNKLLLDMKRKNQAEQEKRNANWLPPANKNQNNGAKSNTLLERYKRDPEGVKNDLSKKEIRALKKELRQEKRNQTEGDSQNFIEALFKGGKPQSGSGNAPDSKTAQELIPNPATGSRGSGMTAPPGSAKRNQQAPSILLNAARQTDSQDPKSIKKSYLFKKIRGMDVKCRQLISLDNQVFAATNNGFY
ncbi:hypothetical protein ACFLR1_07300, partial [Bacteroidota bacterium]